MKRAIKQKKRKRKRDVVVVFCAHPDDQILGAGGTMAHYSKEGKDVYTVIFSYGEASHPWLKGRVTSKIRMNECLEANKIVGGKGVTSFGLREARFKKEVKKKGIKKKIKKILAQKRPSKIFTHVIDDRDPAGDHRIVHDTVLAAVDEAKYKADVYCFDVWNPLNVRKRTNPRMYVDITDTFDFKIKALRCFRSQWVAMTFLFWSVYARAYINGLHVDCKFAERFYKVR
jgi:LmbE family N-acetylglucosaminyl deacetylase